MRAGTKKKPSGRRAPSAPALNEKMLRGLIESSPLGYALLQDGRVVFSNRAMSDICGFSSRELLKMTTDQAAEGFHPEDRARALAVMADRLRGRHPATVQRVRVRHKNGSYRWLETTAVRVSLRGRPALQISYLDVTKRMLAEINLRESEASLRSLIESSTIGIVLVDQDRRVAVWNRAMEGITGIPGSTVRGRPSSPGWFCAQ